MSEEEATISLYPDVTFEEDLTPDYGIEIDEICTKINEATEGWGTDNNELIETLGSTTAEERFLISGRYPELYDTDLRELMKSEASGDFGRALKFLALSPVEAECYMIKKATDGLGTNEKLLYSILSGRANRDMEMLKKTYYKMYSEDLSQLIFSEIGGNFEKIVASCMQAAEEEYDPDYHTEEKAEEDVEELYNAGQGQWFGTDESSLIKIIVMSPPKYLKMMNLMYADKYGYTIVKALEEELGGDSEDAALFQLGMKLKPYDTVANLIKSACAGFGTDELLLTCCIIRYQNIIGQVGIHHQKLHEKSIQDRIKGEVGGNYKKLLLALVDKIYPEE